MNDVLYVYTLDSYVAQLNPLFFRIEIETRHCRDYTSTRCGDFEYSRNDREDLREIDVERPLWGAACDADECA